jgi:2-polyprenyl-3-methyl-5-hydroxy-6-metoxy-1,4-benzoquinol methylase
MTWEETIKKIRTDPQYSELIRLSYLEEDLKLNVERYKNSKEFNSILDIFKQYAPNATKILDIGCGNGITTIAFTLAGYSVTAVEPDPSMTVGAGAINQLVKIYNVTDRVEIIQNIIENTSLRESYDIVFIRQAMHHANNLNLFIEKATLNLKKSGLLLCVRDHVIYNNSDKEWFLNSHPLHKFYRGENAYTTRQYRNAIKNANLKLIKELKYYETVINYFPLENPITIFEKWKEEKKNKFGKVIANDWLLMFYAYTKGIFPPNERRTPGRMHSYIAIKK